MENSERDGNTRPPDLRLEKFVCRSGSNRTGHETTDWFQIGKGVCQGAGRNINNIRYADDTTLMAESKEELKSLLMKVKEESEKAGLKFSIQKTKIMASGPIQFSSIAQSCPTLCDPMNRSTPGLPVPHQLPEFTQTHVH